MQGNETDKISAMAKISTERVGRLLSSASISVRARNFEMALTNKSARSNLIILRICIKFILKIIYLKVRYYKKNYMIKKNTLINNILFFKIY